MIRLSSRGIVEGVDTPIVGVVRWIRNGDLLAVFKSRADALGDTREAAALVCRVGVTVPDSDGLTFLPRLTVPDEIQPLADGDVVALQPYGRIDTMFRSNSLHNTLFITEQCNSYCLMCSQPPRRVDDLDHFLMLNSRTVRLMPSDVPVLGITGGEPTLLGPRLADLVRLCRSALPSAQIDILSNGRNLADERLAATIAASADERVLFTIPLYADNAIRHDYVVQAEGAFNETVLGFYNLAALGVRSEVRVVLHRESVQRLPHLARFAQKNLPFVEQVVFMGLEMIGLARAHEERVWIEPPEYMPALHEAIDHLVSLGMRVSIYNLPRCLVPPALWPYLRQSISDWKREYLPACQRCSERMECGGLFGTSSRLSSLLHPL
jgi:His-Xaa-Ser system radical SAM maturase HxsC